MLEAKAKDRGHRRECSPNKIKKRFSKIFFQAISKKKIFKNFFSGDLKNFNDSKNSAQAENRAIFEDLRLRGQGQKLNLRGQGLQNVSSRTAPLLIIDWQPRRFIYFQ